MWYIHTMGYYSANLEITILSEINKSEKDKCHDTT